MRLLGLLLLIVFVPGCSDLSSVEKELVWKWYWYGGNNEYGSYGALELRGNRWYTYRMNFWNPIECLSERTEEALPYWQIQNQKICFGIPNERIDCRFSLSENHRGHSPEIYIWTLDSTIELRREPIENPTDRCTSG